MVVGIIAGGRNAMFNAIEFAEDDLHQAWKDLREYDINVHDAVIGIAASGSTPYVIGGLRKCREEGIVTGSISCNFSAEISKEADFPVEVELGPEFVTGSTRMKSGTAQKLILNMISTAIMIQLGRVEDNKMVNMQLTNEKLIARGTKMLMEKTQMNSPEEAKALLLKLGSVKKAMDMWKRDNHA
jgi:N-acetylmuramic acid 6-phosphate etherase